MAHPPAQNSPYEGVNAFGGNTNNKSVAARIAASKPDRISGSPMHLVAARIASEQAKLDADKAAFALQLEEFAARQASLAAVGTPTTPGAPSVAPDAASAAPTAPAAPINAPEWRPKAQ